MKKIIILLIAVLFIFTDGFCNLSSSSSSKSPSIREVRIRVLVIGGGKPRPRPRSVQVAIEAELDLDANQLFVEFNEVVGRVTIQVQNSMGQVVNSYSCDTELESFAIIGISDYADNYSISILGEEIEAYGYCEISDY